MLSDKKADELDSIQTKFKITNQKIQNTTEDSKLYQRDEAIK
jgi:hypothetical protein